MVKKLGKLELAIVKRTLQSTTVLKNKKKRLEEKLKKASQEINTEVSVLQAQIDAFESPIKEMTGGLSSEEYLCKTFEEAQLGQPSLPEEAINEFN